MERFDGDQGRGWRELPKGPGINLPRIERVSTGGETREEGKRDRLIREIEYAIQKRDEGSLRRIAVHALNERLDGKNPPSTFDLIVENGLPIDTPAGEIRDLVVEKMVKNFKVGNFVQL